MAAIFCQNDRHNVVSCKVHEPALPFPKLASGPQSGLDAGVDVPLPAVDLDTLLLPPPSFRPALHPSPAPLQAVQPSSGPPPQLTDAHVLCASPPLVSAPQQQPGAQQQPQYHPQHRQVCKAAQQHPQYNQQQQQQPVYSPPQHGQYPTGLTGQPAATAQPIAMALQLPDFWPQGGLQQQQQQQQTQTQHQPPQHLHAMHLQQGGQAPPHLQEPNRRSEGIAAGLAGQGEILAVYNRNTRT
jgi:hypothetical protein